jgi:hypothetical protein
LSKGIGDDRAEKPDKPRSDKPAREKAPQPEEGAVGGRKTTGRAKPTRKAGKGRKIGPKPIAAAPRKKYGLPELGEPGALPPREGALDNLVLEIIEKTGTEDDVWIPIPDEEREVTSLQSSITAAARRVGRPIRTAIRVDPDTGKQVVYAKGV